MQTISRTRAQTGGTPQTIMGIVLNIERTGIPARAHTRHYRTASPERDGHAEIAVRWRVPDMGPLAPRRRIEAARDPLRRCSIGVPQCLFI